MTGVWLSLWYARDLDFGCSMLTDEDFLHWILRLYSPILSNRWRQIFFNLSGVNNSSRCKCIREWKASTNDLAALYGYTVSIYHHNDPSQDLTGHILHKNCSSPVAAKIDPLYCRHDHNVRSRLPVLFHIPVRTTYRWCYWNTTTIDREMHNDNNDAGNGIFPRCHDFYNRSHLRLHSHLSPSTNSDG